METILFLGIIPLAVSGFCLGMILELVKEYNHPQTSREEHYTTCEPANFMYPRLSFRHFVGDNIRIVPIKAEKIKETKEDCLWCIKFLSLIIIVVWLIYFGLLYIFL